MDKYEEFRDRLMQLEHMGNVYLNLGEEAGASVYFIHNIFILFEIPQYGGEERYIGGYADYEEIVSIVRRWT